jgi:DNA-binding transcriptional regulator LsrR (DeoR family)
VYSAGYLDERDLGALYTAGVVGDVCTVFLREDGSHQDIAINRRATGPTPEELARVPRRLCVVAGEAKLRPLLAAIRAGVVTDLVIDEPTARRLVPRRTPSMTRSMVG